MFLSRPSARIALPTACELIGPTGATPKKWRDIVWAIRSLALLTIEWPKYSVALSEMYNSLPFWVSIIMKPLRACSGSITNLLVFDLWREFDYRRLKRACARALTFEKPLVGMSEPISRAMLKFLNAARASFLPRVHQW